jgi:hypothetical protein
MITKSIAADMVHSQTAAGILAARNQSLLVLAVDLGHQFPLKQL